VKLSSFAVLDVSWTMGLTCCYKTACFFTFVINIYSWIMCLW